MKKISLSPSFMVLCIICSVAMGLGLASQAKAQNVEKEVGKIKALMAEQEIAWNKGDLETFMEGYWKSDKLRFIGSAGISYGWQTTLDNYKKRYPGRKAMGILSFDILDVQVLSEDTAWVLGKWKLKREKDEPHGFYTLLWKKIDGKWLIVCDHSS